MDNQIYNYLKSLKYSDNEICLLLSIAPTLEEVSAEEAANNIEAVMHFGYPVEDITFLISQNPAFLCRNFKDLVEDLQKIKNEFGDVEEALKYDPNLI